MEIKAAAPLLTADTLPKFEDMMAQVEPLYEKTWRASDDLIEALPALLTELQPRSVIEFGPGLSSYILQYYCIAMGALYVGIDHEGPYAQEHKSRLGSIGFNPKYTHICPIEGSDSWYSIPNEDQLVNLAPFELILLDGPGDDDARSCPRALELFKAIADPIKTSWVIDDTTRKGSAWLAGKWVPDLMGASTTTIIKDRNFSGRKSSVIVPYHYQETQQ